MLILPATVETIASFVAEARAAPDELTTIANVIPAPPMPFLAAEEVGKRVVLAFMVYVAALYDHPDEAAKNQAWAESFRQALQSDDPGAYVNFMSVDWQARMHEAYPHRTWERLAAIKARYDPTNLFRLNQNVPPAPGITNSPNATGKR